MTEYLTPGFDARAKLDIALECLRHGGACEVAFACGWDFTQKKVTTGRVVFRGSPSRTSALSTDFGPSEPFLLHNHPSGIILPSEQDIAAAEFFATRGVGFGICDNYAEQLYVVREPDRPKPTPLPPKRWSLSFGPWHFNLMRSASK